MKLTVNIVPGINPHEMEVDLEDLNITDEDWNGMDSDEQRERLEHFISCNAEKNYWLVEEFRESNQEE